MGIKKNKITFYQKAMKFYSLVALICGASAIKIAHKPASNNLVSLKTYAKVHSFAKNKVKAYQPDWDLTPQQEEDIATWVMSELSQPLQRITVSRLPMRSGKNSETSSAQSIPTAITRSIWENSWLPLNEPANTVTAC